VKHWPLSVIISSPLMSPAFAWELFRVYQTHSLSVPAIDACLGVASRTVAQTAPGLVLVRSVGSSTGHRLFLGYPEWPEWFALERGGLLEEADGNIVLSVDSVH
jgi:hypothetical protein